MVFSCRFFFYLIVVPGRSGKRVTSGFFSPGEALLNPRRVESSQIKTVSLTNFPDGSSHEAQWGRIGGISLGRGVPY